MRNSVPALNARDGRNFIWDYIILDEAHQIKVKKIKSFNQPTSMMIFYHLNHVSDFCSLI